MNNAHHVQYLHQEGRIPEVIAPSLGDGKMIISVDVTEKSAADRLGAVTSGELGNDWQRWSLLARWLVFLTLAAVLSGRPLYVAPDDASYVDYFEMVTGNVERLDKYKGSYTWIVEEPLWIAYTSVVSRVFTSENALRFTIFISIIAFLIGATKLSRDSWVIIVFAFIFDGTLATQTYFNQIRQGVGMALFAMVAAQLRSLVLGALCASLVHSVFLPLLACAILVKMARNNARVLIIGIVAFVVGLMIYRQEIAGLDWGRRTLDYEFSNALNYKFFLVYGSIGGVVAYLSTPQQRDSVGREWFFLTCTFGAVAIGICLIHEAGGRLIYVVNALLLIAVGRSYASKVRIPVALWLAVVLGSSIYEHSKLGGDSMIDRWGKILSRTETGRVL